MPPRIILTPKHILKCPSFSLFFPPISGLMKPPRQRDKKKLMYHGNTKVLKNGRNTFIWSVFLSKYEKMRLSILYVFIISTILYYTISYSDISLLPLTITQKAENISLITADKLSTQIQLTILKRKLSLRFVYRCFKYCQAQLQLAISLEIELS